MPVGPMRSRLRCWAIQAQVAREWPRAVPVQVLERGLAAEVGLAQAAPELALLALGPLGVHEQAEAVLEAERGELGVAELALTGLGEGRQAQGHQFVDGGVSKHGASSRV